MLSCCTCHFSILYRWFMYLSPDPSPKSVSKIREICPKSEDSMAESDFFFDFSPYNRHFFKKYMYLCTKFI